MLTYMHEYYIIIQVKIFLRYQVSFGSNFSFKLISNKNFEEIVTYLAYTSPTLITNSSKLTFYTSEPNTVYNTKPQLEVVEYITKYTGLFLMELMSFPDNSSYYR